MYFKFESFITRILIKIRKFAFIFGSVSDESLFNASFEGIPGLEFSDSAIVITTFEARFEAFAIPLISQIRSISDIEIFVIINGNYGITRSRSQLNKFLRKIVLWEGVNPIVFNTMQGCAKMWNSGIIHADCQYTFIFNDDIIISEKSFLNDIRSARSLAVSRGLVTINSSWSYFCISQETIKNVGFFEERFLGFGEEDGDYRYRYQEFAGELVANINLSGFLNVVDESRDARVSAGIGKYSLFNTCLMREMYQESENGITGSFDIPMKKQVDYLNPNPVFFFRKHFQEFLGEESESRIRQELNSFFKK